MERIAPLARILAEANGIEWEHLSGTGGGGQIVEQDILDYLTRVMSGDAEPPSTPVDAPPPDWNGEDVPGAGMFDASMLSKAGVESDIAEFVGQARPAPAVANAAPTMATPQQDDFELEDDDQDSLMAPEPTMPPAAAASAGVAAGAATGAAGLGNLLSRLYQTDGQQAASVPIQATQPPQPAPAAPPVPQAAPIRPVIPAPAVAPVAPPVAHTPPSPASVSPVPASPVSASPVPAPALSIPAMPAAPQGAVPANAVWFGTYLRRDLQVKELANLCQQLSEALGQEVPLALLVARAAQRAAHLIGLQEVAVQHPAQDRHLMVHPGGMREALYALNTGFEGHPELLVIDAGALDLDDLHYPEMVTLSLGRLHDDRATLSLNGPVNVQQAAEFLASVAALLEKPVILLV